jgi:hypothetical protein
MRIKIRLVTTTTTTTTITTITTLTKTPLKATNNNIE